MSMDKVSFKISKADNGRVARVVKRAIALAATDGIELDEQSLSMDIVATHANGNPLDFKKLLDFDDANFGHDVLGIRRFIDRNTGTLGGHFVPRCSVPQTVTV